VSRKPTNEQPETTEEQVQPSRKREMTAVAAAAAVTVVLGMAANIAIGKLSAQVQNRIASKHQPANEIETTN
jgi:NADH:ubiquinone oxidoreductase subunit 4 (subunit M)